MSEHNFEVESGKSIKLLTKNKVCTEDIVVSAYGGSGIPEGYIKPDGTLEIKENGTFDVTAFAKAFVNVPTSAEGGGGLVYDMGTFVFDTDRYTNTQGELKVPHNLGKVPRMIIVWTDDYAGITEPPYPTTGTHLGFVWLDKLMRITQQLTSAADSSAPFCSHFILAKNSVKATWQCATSGAYGLVWLPTDTDFTCPYMGSTTYWRAGVEYKYFVSEGFW